jgi:hypothetical protein
MRNLVVMEFMSLDEVVEVPMWTFKYWNDEIAAFKKLCEKHQDQDGARRLSIK